MNCDDAWERAKVVAKEQPATGAGLPVDWDAVDARWSEARDALSDFVPEPDSETVAHFAAVLDKVKAEARRAALEEAVEACIAERNHRAGLPEFEGANACVFEIQQLLKGGEGNGK